MSGTGPLRTAHRFRSETPPDKKFKVDDLLAFKRGRGDLPFSIFIALVALFFLGAFWSYSGWQDRSLPDDFGTYLLRQLGVVEGEGRLTRFGRILRQGWVAPAVCLAILLPAAFVNLRQSWRVHAWRVRFKQPTDMEYELSQWVRALEFVGWFIAYTLIVPILGYLFATLLFGTLLPWRMGYRGWRWFFICLAASFAIVLLFRTGLQIKTPVNIWLYSLLPPGPRGFMATWF
ncbi:MAG: tripartite tricarboxylate transporter TctB family protein [Pseudomonadota bacterium]